MTLTESVSSCFRKYATFSGRASRSEYWFFIVFYLLAGTIASFIDARLFPQPEMPGEEVYFSIGIHSSDLNGPISAIFFLITLIPWISVTARRLHDSNTSGWWQIIFIAPVLIVIPFAITVVMALVSISFILSLIVLVWLIKKGTDGENRFGRDPLELR